MNIHIHIDMCQFATKPSSSSIYHVVHQGMHQGPCAVAHLHRGQRGPATATGGPLGTSAHLGPPGPPRGAERFKAGTGQTGWELKAWKIGIFGKKLPMAYLIILIFDII